MMTILIDNGHGVETPGKRSPDGVLREYQWTREVARALQSALADDYEVILVTPEESDIPLAERVRRVNAVCAARGADNCLLLSLHINPAGNGERWHEARGFSAWVAPPVPGKPLPRRCRLAALLQEEAERRGLRGNRAVPPEKFWCAKFTILTRTKCAAVLTENLFQDNRDDVAFLLSTAGKAAIVALHREAVKCAEGAFESQKSKVKSQKSGGRAASQKSRVKSQK